MTKLLSNWLIQIKKDDRWTLREYGLDISIIFTCVNLACIIDCLFLGLLVSVTHTSRTAMIYSSIFSGLCCISSFFIYKVPNV